MEMKDFREMPYERPDLAAYGEQLKKTAEIMRSAGSYEEARAAYFALQQMTSRMETQFSVAYVRNTIDTRDPFYEEEVRALEEGFARLTPLNKEFSEAFASCAFRADFEREFGLQLL